MNRLLPLALLLLLCGCQPRPQAAADPLDRCLAYQDAMDGLRLPVQVDRVEWPGPPEACQPPVLTVTGTASAADLEKALGFRARIQVQGPPDLPPAPRQDQPAHLGALRAQVRVPPAAVTGRAASIAVELHNSGPLPLRGVWGLNTVEYELLTPRGEVVRFGPQGSGLLAGLSLDCPAAGLCTGGITFDLPLNRFNPALPLSPGRYALRVRLRDLEVDGQTVSATLPDVALTVIR